MKKLKQHTQRDYILRLAGYFIKASRFKTTYEWYFDQYKDKLKEREPAILAAGKITEEDLKFVYNNYYDVGLYRDLWESRLLNILEVFFAPIDKKQPIVIKKHLNDWKKYITLKRPIYKKWKINRNKIDHLDLAAKSDDNLLFFYGDRYKRVSDEFLMDVHSQLLSYINVLMLKI